MKGRIAPLASVGAQPEEPQVFVAQIEQRSPRGELARLGAVALVVHVDGRRVEVLLSPGEASATGAQLTAASFTAAGLPPPVLEQPASPLAPFHA